MRTCHCTNQCPACGQCCQVGCAHRGTAGGSWVPAVPFQPTSPEPHSAPPQRDLEVRIVPRKPLTEEGLERILKEAFAEALKELRDLIREERGGPEDQRA